MGFAVAQKLVNSLSTPPAKGGPPPLPGSVPAYYLGIGGQQVGPLDLNSVRGEIASGRVSRATLVWKEGMAGWEPAERIPEVAALFPPSLGS
jgi:hypothetical protein